MVDFSIAVEVQAKPQHSTSDLPLPSCLAFVFYLFLSVSEFTLIISQWEHYPPALHFIILTMFNDSFSYVR